MAPDDLYATFLAMELRGGSFCRALAAAWYAADPDNKRRIQDAWPELLAKYSHLSPLAA